MSTALLTSPGQINLAGLTLNAVDDNGVVRAFSKIDGWHDGPSIDVQQTQRIVSHGQFPQASHRGGRQITVNGSIHAAKRGLVASAVQELATVLADGGFGVFEFVDENLGSQWTLVQLLETPAVDWDESGLLCRFQIVLLAPSPYKFGAVSQAVTLFASEPEGAGLIFPLFSPDGVLDFGVLGDVGQAAVTNEGTAKASVRFTVTGPTPEAGFVITDTVTGARIQYLGQVPANSELVIDSADGSVLIDGTADRLGDTIVDAWPTVPAGETRAFLFESNGTNTPSTMTVEVTATYW